MRLQCGNKKCGHVWNYKGKQRFRTNCPSCGYKVNIHITKHTNSKQNKKK